MIDKKQKREDGCLKDNDSAKRRSFLKKVAYTAPTLLALGSLTRPSDAKAGFGPPPSAPNSFS